MAKSLLSSTNTMHHIFVSPYLIIHLDYQMNLWLEFIIIN